MLASCGFPPEFAPVDIDGRLLGDGGLCANAPIEAVLEEPTVSLTCLVVDLYARKGKRPTTIEAAFARRSDLLFSNQTWQRLRAYKREIALRRTSADSVDSPRILQLSYRAPPEEAGPEKIFDYSRRSVTQRWRAGKTDGAFAMERLSAMAPGGILSFNGANEIKQWE